MAKITNTVSALSGHYTNLMNLICSGADISGALAAINASELANILREQDESNNTLLHWVVENDNEHHIRKILEAASNKGVLLEVLTLQDDLDDTPLHFALRSGKDKAIALIVNSMSQSKAGLEKILTIQNNFGVSAFELIISRGETALFQQIVTRATEFGVVNQIASFKSARGNDILKTAQDAGATGIEEQIINRIVVSFIPTVLKLKADWLYYAWQHKKLSDDSEKLLEEIEKVDAGNRDKRITTNKHTKTKFANEHLFKATEDYKATFKQTSELFPGDGQPCIGGTYHGHQFFRLCESFPKVSGNTPNNWQLYLDDRIPRIKAMAETELELVEAALASRIKEKFCTEKVDYNSTNAYKVLCSPGFDYKSLESFVFRNESGPDKDPSIETDYYGNPPLYTAILKNSSSEVENVIKKEYQLDKLQENLRLKGEDSKNLLHFIFRSDNPQIIKQVLSVIDINTFADLIKMKDISGTTPLAQLIEGENAKILNLILENCTTEQKSIIVSAIDDNHYTLRQLVCLDKKWHSLSQVVYDQIGHDQDMVKTYLNGSYIDHGKYDIDWCADIRYEDSGGVLLGLHNLLSGIEILKNLKHGVDRWIPTDSDNI